MTLSEFYKYSWFSNMAYVSWSDANTANRDAMIAIANNSNVARIPEALGEFIFDQDQENWIKKVDKKGDRFIF